MRGFLAAVGAALALGGSGCAPLAKVAPTAVTPRIVMDETFVRAWPDDPGGTAWFADGGYRLASRQPGQFVAVRAPLAEVPRDVIVSGTFRKVSGPAGGGYGLIVADQQVGAGDGNDQVGQYVVAEVGDRGEIGVWRRDGTHWTDLVPWTASSAVHTDTTANDLSVQLVDDRLRFVVNGAQVADVAHIGAVGPRPGGVGIFAGGDLNEVVLNRFLVQAPALADDGRATPVAPAAAQPIRQSRPPAGQSSPSNAITTPSAQPGQQGVRDLLAGIADDMGAIVESFAGGLDNAHNPVSDPNALKMDQARLEAAMLKATRLLAALQRLQHGALSGR